MPRKTGRPKLIDDEMTLIEVSKKLDKAIKEMEKLNWKGAKVYKVSKKSKARR